MAQDLIARFVDQISATRQIRVDINDGRTWRLQADSRFDPPRAKRARASTLLTDGAVYPASAYDDRVLDLSLLLETDSADQAGEQIQRLVRELDRPDGNVLEYQLPGASDPVFFRTIRLAVESIDMPTDGTQHWLRVPVIAEPFGYGLKETVSPVTVNNDPAAAANGMFLDVSGVKGDVETPAKINVPAALNGSQSVFAIRRRGTVANVPFVLQAESMSQSTDTSIQSNDSVMSGAGSNYSRTTFATVTAMSDRLTITAHPAAASVDARGRYRVFGRFRHSVSGDTIKVQMFYGPTLVSAGIVTLPNTTALVFVDLGLIEIPAGMDPVFDGSSGTELAPVGIRLSVAAERASGSGNLDHDVFLLVPAGPEHYGRLAIVNWGSVAPPTDLVWDGPRRGDLYGTDSSGNLVSLGAPYYVGGPMMLSPGVTNRVYFIRNVTPGVSTDKTQTTSVALSYWPRYLGPPP